MPNFIHSIIDGWSPSIGSWSQVNTQVDYWKDWFDIIEKAKKYDMDQASTKEAIISKVEKKLEELQEILNGLKDGNK